MYHSKIGEIIRNLFLFSGFRISRTTKRDKLLEFFKKVTPMETNKHLIRVGGENDGGYLIPDDLDGIKECFSPGVSVISKFEDEMTHRGIQCYLADYSVDSPPIKNSMFVFEKKFLGVTNNEVFVTLTDWVLRNKKSNSDLILQMDIEGAEWGGLANTSIEILRQFRIVVIEFHDLDGLFDPLLFKQINDVFDILLQEFVVVHIHPNNSSRPLIMHQFKIPPVMEFTFLRKDRIENLRPASVFPHPLDSPNVKEMYDYALPTCWYK